MRYFNLQHIKSLNLEKLPVLSVQDSWEVLKIPQLFSLNELESKLQNLLQHASPAIKDNDVFYRGICLQSTSEDVNPLFDQLDSLFYYDRLGQIKNIRLGGNKIDKINSAGEMFRFVFNQFEGRLDLKRGRLLVAKPGALLARHRDAQGTGTLHIPIRSNPFCHLVVNDHEYFLDPDGSAYLVNTDHFHFMYNAGQTDRYHLIFNVDFKK